MSPALWVGAALVGAIGALARFGVERRLMPRRATRLPVGTLVVNLSGAVLLGLLVGAGVTGDARRLVGTAALGAYTTFSAWMLESERLAEAGAYGWVALNLGGALVGGLAAVALGREVSALL